MRFNSDLEDAIGIYPIQTWGHKLRSNSDLEAQITSDLQDEIGISVHKLRFTSDLEAQIT